MPEADEFGSKEPKGATFKYRKIFNTTVKQLYFLPKETSHDLILKIMGSWSAEAMYTQNYARNANLFIDKYIEEIQNKKHNELVKSIGKKLKTIKAILNIPWHVKASKYNIGKGYDIISQPIGIWNLRKSMMD